MSYCGKCGSKVTDDMVFCPKCGASLKAGQTSTVVTHSIRYRNEKAEKGEKHEKAEKGEKHEKHEHAFIGPFIGGLILLFVGLMFYLHMVWPEFNQRILGAAALILIGVLIIIGAAYGAVLASRRNPRT